MQVLMVVQHACRSKRLPANSKHSNGEADELQQMLYSNWR
jgi:hypothetical protein